MPQRSASDVVIVDRLEVHLAREHEVVVGEARHLVEQALERDANGVLHEARLQVRMLHDEQLVGALEELEHRRAHRALDEIDERLGVDVARRADEQRARPRWLWVAIGTSWRICSMSSALEARLGQSLRRPGRRRGPGAHGHALIPVASTPTTRREPCSVAAAIPISETISCVGSPVTGVMRRIGQRAVIRTSARTALLALDDVARDDLGELLDDPRLAEHGVADRLVEELGKRDM